MSASEIVGRAELLDELEPIRTLPEWLVAASDASVVHAALAAATGRSTTATGDAALIAGKGARLRLRQHGWDARYEATLRDNDGSERPIALTGNLNPPGRAATGTAASGRLSDATFTCQLPELGLVLRAEATDEALPLLDTLLDPVRARSLIERTVNHNRSAMNALHLARCEPRAMRYKPGSRCTVVYDVEATWSDDRPAPNVVVAKTYRGEKGLIAYDGMRALWASPLADSHVVHIAEPLGYLDDEHLLIQGPVREETTIKAVVKRAATTDTTTLWEWLGNLVVQAADGLAELHNSGAKASSPDADLNASEGQRRVHLDGHLTKLATVVPEPAAAAGRVLDTILAWSATCPPDPDVPSHGSFRPAQVLVAGDEISFIDFDGFCSAEPAMDVALFCASLKVAGMTAAAGAGRSGSDLAKCLQHLLELGDRFVDRYDMRRPVSRERVAQWEALDLLTQLVHGWTKVSQDRLDGTVPLLCAHLERWLPDTPRRLHGE